ncbi:MAG: bifunctional 23S rRNA (guanine(2069)-N(7))-methyltransferase RlmK/23S rRNA (guanine(2445)-N(2))-methyltransferase RlmL [Gammaproteobacteria bacterium]|nr:bifunctional 23S rRNA (guanine(2069)-N(7))-methyltransferase RlmK/23S rRNA (guanine(2445)-N(2))-methyltransferase RlmL [Gammaproteobacteria bacterium]
MPEDPTLFAPAPPALVALLAAELRELGASRLHRGHAGVRFRASLEVAYRACLWSRLANRVLLQLTSFRAESAEELYRGIRAIDWSRHMEPRGTLAVDFVTSRSRLDHSRFGAQKTKDAVVDRLREATGLRPTVDRERPDLRIHVHVDRDVATVSLDLAGESLHRRGYRRQAGAAPLKENLAAAVVLHGGWRELARAGAALVDPMCGAGTLAIEGALIAADAAPGLAREHFGFLAWRGHDAALWMRLLDEARERRRRGLAAMAPVHAFDSDADAVGRARDNAARAGLAARVAIERREIGELEPPAAAPGLVVLNPPYGRRLHGGEDLAALYRRTGEVLRRRFHGWRAAVIHPRGELGRALALGLSGSLTLTSGALELELVHGTLAARAPAAPHTDTTALANRLGKNLRHVARWARREGVDCYRIYDRDLPEFAFAIDVYECDGRRVVAQEYAAPRGVDPERAAARREAALATVASVLEVAPERVVTKTRRRQRGADRYGRLAEVGELREVREHGCRLLVNLEDRLDTGLYLDHRPVRRLVAARARGRRFLNLFAYTAAASVHAAAAGATHTTSVDLSATYLDWARRNLELNGFRAPAHRLVRADCLAWLDEPAADQPWDLALLDPPTFSNSKRMGRDLDVERDHVSLIVRTMDRLAPAGELVFSCHARRFRIDADALARAGLTAEQIATATADRDLARARRAHRCWLIRRRAG